LLKNPYLSLLDYLATPQVIEEKISVTFILFISHQLTNLNMFNIWCTIPSD